ncbi:tripartite motif-containing protein 2-like [Anneissia japonica]|uniref:tripartite motif-containing protein 2-like n=1 Tax=Anneissia japonica TaxID=1529436 RepID=UPI001425A8A4|nr:tripartite motif-containing protein 2-like [Anneissia japonica]
MSFSKVVKDLDQKVLECPICMKRLTQPRTLPCLHTYCLACLETWVEVQSELKCPLCSGTYPVPEGGVQKLAPNTTINNLLEYVETMEKTEEEDPQKLLCMCRKSPPTHFCKECVENVCIDCKQSHKSSRLKSKKHTLYPLNELVIPSVKEVMTSQKNYCNVHKTNVLEFFCKQCVKLVCGLCRDELHKKASEHSVVTVSTACVEYKTEVHGLVTMANEMKIQTQAHLHALETSANHLKTSRDTCKNNIDACMHDVIKEMETGCQDLKKQVEAVYKVHICALRSKMQKLQSFVSDVSGDISVLKDTFGNFTAEGSFESCVSKISTIRARLNEMEVDRTKFSPKLDFIPSQELTSALRSNGVGKIGIFKDVYKVSEADTIEVNEGERFTIGIDSFMGTRGTCELMAKLKDPLGQESIADISQQGRRCVVTGVCKIVGKWVLSIRSGTEVIQGSPVIINVRKRGLCITIPNIIDYMEHYKDTKVMNVLLNREGLLLVTSAGRDVLKFTQSGEFISKVVLQPGTRVTGLCNVNEDILAYSDFGNKCVTTCNHDFKEVLSFGKGIVKFPRGLAVRQNTNNIYVADHEVDCVFRFNYETGKHIGTIGSTGRGIGQMLSPQDVAITKDGHVLVADLRNHRICMLDTNDKFVKIMVGFGKTDGKVVGPGGIVVCEDDTFIVSSNNKLQHFDRNGVLIKRVDKDKDGLNAPVFMALLSSRTVAVANHKEDEVKIFTY